MQNSPCVFSQKVKASSLEPLRANKYRQDAGLTPVAKLAFSNFGATNFDSTSEHGSKEYFLKNIFLLAVSGGRNRHFCVQKLAMSGQRGIEWALERTWITPIKVPDSDGLTDHEFLKLSSSASTLLGLVLRDTTITAVVKSRV